jgi:hypothetical protein
MPCRIIPLHAESPGVGPTRLGRRGHGRARSFPEFDRRKTPDTGPGEGQGDDEAGEAPAGTAHGNFTKVSPIDLRLFGRERMQAQKGFRASWAQRGYRTAQLDDTALVATLANHLVDARGP